ncbi:MAG: copper-translocating P-type ATPase, partial [Clostridia bacterium]|nr:copper-translocating P-type ATPase [Clostridia bacterium]
MEKYNVSGMSCAACSARVEGAVKKVPGVTSCAVSLLTNSMSVEGDADERKIIEAVERAGYGAAKAGAPSLPEREKKGDAEREIKRLVVRLVTSASILLVLMYFSMGHMMWGFPVPAVFENHVFSGTFQMIVAASVMIVNSKFFISGTKAALHAAPNMDTLVALGSASAFIYSTVNLFIMISAQGAGDSETVMKYGMDLYFESAAMIPTLITVGKLLEAISKGKTTSALKGLMEIAPKSATVEKDGEEIKIGIEELSVGDIFIVRSGESFPADGVVIGGAGSVDESALTGESVPSDKETGDSVSAATLCSSGYFKCRAEKVGSDTLLSQIIKTVSDAAATKAPIARIADRVSAVFVPSVIAIATVTFIVWMALGKSLPFALGRAISVLVISCPCALGLATPVAVMVGSGVGARHGILFKSAESLEQIGKTEYIALDKTGTITSGTPVVTDVIPYGVSKDEFVRIAASIERMSEHPLARAVAGSYKGAASLDVAGFETLPGCGVKGVVTETGETLEGGSVKYIVSKYEVPKDTQSEASSLSEDGKTPILFVKGGRYLGLIALADTIKPDSAEAVSELKGMGVDVVMLTGDNEKCAAKIGRDAGIDRVVAGVLPTEKSDHIKELKQKGRCAMVGDGINDAPALTAADTGVALGAGTDVAIDAADVVIMKNSLKDVSAALRISRRTIKNIKENLFWAFIY